MELQFMPPLLLLLNQMMVPMSMLMATLTKSYRRSLYSYNICAIPISCSNVSINKPNKNVSSSKTYISSFLIFRAPRSSLSHVPFKGTPHSDFADYEVIGLSVFEPLSSLLLAHTPLEPMFCSRFLLVQGYSIQISLTLHERLIDRRN